MRLSETLKKMDHEFTKMAAAEEVETKDALQKREEAITLGKALADRDLGLRN